MPLLLLLLLGHSVRMSAIFFAWYANTGELPTAAMKGNVNFVATNVWCEVETPTIPRVTTTVRTPFFTEVETTLTLALISTPGVSCPSTRSVTVPFVPSTMMAYGEFAIELTSKPMPNQTVEGPLIVMVATPPSFPGPFDDASGARSTVRETPIDAASDVGKVVPRVEETLAPQHTSLFASVFHDNVAMFFSASVLIVHPAGRVALAPDHVETVRPARPAIVFAAAKHAVSFAISLPDAHFV